MIEVDEGKFIKKVGKTIREFRQAKGLSQAQVADILGISPSALSKIEHGKVSISVEKLRTVALLCRLKVSDLLRRVEAEEVFWEDKEPSQQPPLE